MSTSSRFNAFCSNIKLTSAQIADARTKYDHVCRILHNHYYPTTTYNGSTKLLIGSYGKGTATRPPGDVDVIFKIPYDTYNRFHENKTGPRGLLNDLKTVLSKTFTTTEKIKPNGMVVQVSFLSFSIEVLPGYEWIFPQINGTFTVPDTSFGYTTLPTLYNFGFTTNYGRWKDIDPRKEMAELNGSDILCKGNTKNLVRMMKKWLQFCSVPLKGVVIERLVREFMWSFNYSDKSAIYYDWLVRDFFKYLLGKRNATVSMSGINEDIQIGDAWFSKAESAHKRSVRACEFEGQSKEFDAAYEWKKIFGSDYPY